MNVIEKNAGEKIPFSVSKSKVTFRDELTLDLSKYERDYDVQIDICESRDNILMTGISDRYVAQLLIPARQYNEETTGTGESQSITKTAIPFDPAKVTLTLWTLEEAE